MLYPEAAWGDVTRIGRIVASYRTGSIRADDRTVPAPPEPLLFVRADEGPAGLVIVGQGHRSGEAWAWVEGHATGWQTLGITHGVFCVETDGHTIYVQRTPSRYAIHSVTTTAVDVQTYPGPDGTSQGFLDCTDPGLLWTDYGRLRDGLMLPQRAGAWLVGQHPEADAILARCEDDVRVILQRQGLFEPRAAYVDGALIVLIRAVEGLVILRGQPTTWPAWRPADGPVRPDVSPPSSSPGEPEMSTLNLLPLLLAERNRYGPRMTDDECVDLLNRVAWAARTEGLGLSRKTTGTRGRRYDGVECCHDVLMLRDGTYWDVLEAAGAESRPVWGPPAGRITDPARGWVAPIPPREDAIPAGPPPGPPGPPSSVDAHAIDALGHRILEAIAGVDARVERLERAVEAARRGLADVEAHVRAAQEAAQAQGTAILTVMQPLVGSWRRARPLSVSGRIMGVRTVLSGSLEAIQEE